MQGGLIWLECSNVDVWPHEKLASDLAQGHYITNGAEEVYTPSLLDPNLA